MFLPLLSSSSSSSSFSLPFSHHSHAPGSARIQCSNELWLGADGGGGAVVVVVIPSLVYLGFKDPISILLQKKYYRGNKRWIHGRDPGS